MNSSRHSKITFISAAISGLLTTSTALAAPGIISNSPLQTAASAKPNIMFHLDSSGSMDIISPTPIGSHTYTCTDASARIPVNSTGITLVVNTTTSTDALGGTVYTYTPRISWNGSTRPLGNSSSSYCFDPAGTYTANINTNTSFIGSVPYRGSFLNWYFDTTTDKPVVATDTWNNLGYKPGAKSRSKVAKEALINLLDTLKSVRAGLSIFDRPVSGFDSPGASIKVPVDDITTNISSIKTAINAVVPSGSTPLSESLRDLGLYFSMGTAASTKGSCGGGAANLVLHPGESNEASIACSTVLDDPSATRISNSGTSGISSNTIGPIQAFCQKNFVVMLTDGLPTSDSSIYSGLKDYDGDCTPAAQTAGSYTCLGSNGTSVVSDPATTTSPYFTDVKSTDPVLNASSNTDFFDDVAKALYKIDLRPNLNDESNKPVVNNVITYTIGFADLQVRNSLLLRDAAQSGGGMNFYAEDSTELAQVFRAAMSDIEGRSSTASAVTFNSSTLSSQSAVYQALFNTQRWSGELKSRPLDGFSGDVIDPCSGTNCWEASESLDNQVLVPGTKQFQDTRVILTMGYNHDTGIDTGVAFQAPAFYLDYLPEIFPFNTGVTIKSELIGDLCKFSQVPATGCDIFNVTAESYDKTQTLMNGLFDYLRGDRNNESISKFRIRTHLLGDLVNSSPVYVGKPSMPWPDGGLFPVMANPDAGCGTITDDTAYSCWIKGSRKDRQPVVYVAANDGMLHGFRTSDGNEVIAYIPSGTFSANTNAGLHYLAENSYEHRFYNDLTPTIADVYINHKNSSGGSTGTGPYDTNSREWRTMLIGGLSAGGRQLYMLDVTDPTLFSDSNASQLVQWEFSHAHNSNMGYSFSKPTIAMLNDGRFAAIFGNGYNSDTCKAGLFVLYLEGGLDGTWTATTDYKFIDTGVGSGLPGSDTCNGMSTPALVDLDHNGTVDRVYAGDLLGNLWAFDMCKWDTTNSVCQTSGYGLANASPIMKATNAAGVAQPITVKPVVSRDPASTGFDDLIVVFGTGQYLTTKDIDMTLTQQVQSMYGVRDYDALTNGRSLWAMDPRNNSFKFIQQTITQKTCTTTGCGGKLVRMITTPEKSMGSTNRGWLIDLPVNGERVVVNPKIRNNNVFFNTLIPETEICTAGGDGWIMSVNLGNGGIPLEAVFDLNNDGVIDGQDVEGNDPPVGEKIDAIPAESTFLGDNQYTPDSTGNIGKRKVNVGKGQREGRLSWRELYQDD